MRALFLHKPLFQQRLHPRYYYELVSLQFLNMTDTQGNLLTLYQSDYIILLAYLKKEGITNFARLETHDKLNHLEKAQVRLIRYFPAERLESYELDVKSTTECQTSEILSKDGKALCKNGQQNCVVLFNDHIYIHPKIRAVPGPVSHEVLPDLIADPDTKKGTIGVYHPSFSQGHQVSFAGSIVFDKKLGWVHENTSGHYFPSAYQIKPLIIALQEQGMDLSKLMLRLFILKEPGTIASDFNETYFDIFIENAADYMRRMEQIQTRYGL
jgi:hypothetical protein